MARIEDVSRRGLTFKNFIEDDKNILVVSPGPIHYLDDWDQWQDNEYNIIPEQNWEFEYSARKNNFCSYFNDVTAIENFTLAGFEIVNRDKVARWINYKLYGATPTGCSYEGNRFKYTDVFPEIDLEYLVTPESLKENIILKSAINQSFTFTLKLDAGIRMEPQDTGEVWFIDVDTQELLWKIAKPFAMDAEGLYTDKVRYTFGKQVYDSIEYDALTVTIDDFEFINAAVYPVVIDPTTSLITTGDCSIYYMPSGGNGSGILDDDTGSISIYTDKDADGLAERIAMMMKFNLSSIPSNADKSTATAKILLYIQSVSSYDSRASSIGVGAILVPWTIGSSFSAPADSSFRDSGTSFNYTIATSPYPTNLTITNANLNTIVQNWLNGVSPNYGLLIYVSATPSQAGKSTDRLNIASMSNTGGYTKPTLEVTYNLPPNTPTVVTPGTVNTAASLYATATDPDANNITYEFDLSVDGGSTYKAIGTSASVASGTQGSITYDFTSEATTTQAKLRVRAKDSSGVYSSYGYSNLFTIAHNQPPTAPTSLTRGDFDARQAGVRFTWQHNDPDANPQGAYQLKIRRKSDSVQVLDTGKVSTANQYYDIPANTLVNGTQYEWQVCTWDNQNTQGPYSAWNTFTCYQKPMIIQGGAFALSQGLYVLQNGVFVEKRLFDKSGTAL